MFFGEFLFLNSFTHDWAAARKKLFWRREMKNLFYFDKRFDGSDNEWKLLRDLMELIYFAEIGKSNKSINKRNVERLKLY